jgi:hypothetical protein
MKRKNFIRQGFSAGAAMLYPFAINASAEKKYTDNGKPFKLNYAFHDGM